MNLRVVAQWPIKAIGSSCAVALLLLFPLCHSVAAPQKLEEQKEQALAPFYLSTVAPLVTQGQFGSGTGTFLGKPYTNSISWYVDSLIREVRYKVPAGYNRFIATVGVDDTVVNTTIPFTFTVQGIDANAKVIQLDTKQSYALHRPNEINVFVGNISLLILRYKTDGATYNHGAAWWGDARFENITGPVNPGGGKGISTLVFDDKGMKQKLLDLSQDLMKNFTAKELALPLFPLETQADAPLDPKNAAAIQEGLRDALNQTKPTELASLKESYSELLKDWKPGDDLSDAARKALHKDIDQTYALLGTISDRKENALVAAAIYDLRTGKPIAAEKSQVKIPIQARQTIGPPQVAGGGGGGGVIPPNDSVSTTFSPDDKLRATSYQWVVDGMAQPEVKVSGLNTMDIPVPLDKKKHQFTLRWSGDGLVFDDPVFKRKRTDYKKGSVIFEIEVSEPVQIEVDLQVRDQFVSHSLTKKVMVNRKEVPSR